MTDAQPVANRALISTMAAIRVGRTPPVSLICTTPAPAGTSRASRAPAKPAYGSSLTPRLNFANRAPRGVAPWPRGTTSGTDRSPSATVAGAGRPEPEQGATAGERSLAHHAGVSAGQVPCGAHPAAREGGRLRGRRRGRRAGR